MLGIANQYNVDYLYFLAVPAFLHVKMLGIANQYNVDYLYFLAVPAFACENAWDL
jgi:hypothetical protein